MLLSRRTALALGSALALAGPARADPIAGLYRARTIVVGRRPGPRMAGMVRCLAQVLVRVSGDRNLAMHPLLVEASKTPDAAVKTYAYQDLHACRPIANDAGTCDRPCGMTVSYDAAKIDALLGRLGSKPWLAGRPRLVVFLAVRHGGRSYMLTSRAEHGDLMRQSLRDAAWTSGLEVAIPPPALFARAGLTVEETPRRAAAELLPFVDRQSGELPLVGQLDWSRTLLAWAASWRLAVDGAQPAWTIAGVSFDTAFRAGLGGAAQRLSGRGAIA